MGFMQNCSCITSEGYLLVFMTINKEYKMHVNYECIAETPVND